MISGRIAQGLFLFLFVPFAPLSLAANSGMVEKSVEELKEVNEEALSQIPDKPSDGRITLKGRVSGTESGRRVEVEEYSIEKTKGEVPGAVQGRGQKVELVNPIEEGRVDVPIK